MRYFGSLIGVAAAEPFYVREALNVDDPLRPFDAADEYLLVTNVSFVAYHFPFLICIYGVNLKK